MTNAPELTVELSQAEHYFATRINANTWDEADEANRLKALSTAQTLISGAFVFAENAYFVDATTNAGTWSPRVVAAVCEEALHLLKCDPSTTPNVLTMGISEAGAGGASAKFDRSFVAPLICDTAKVLVGDLGTFVAGDAGTIRSGFLGW